MEGFFRAVAIGLGVLMGTFQTGVEPDLQVTVHKVERMLVLDADLTRALSPKMEEALDEGVPMALTLKAEVDGVGPTPVTQVLSYLPLAKKWQVARGGGDPVGYATRSEAERDWLRWSALAAGSAPAGAFTINVRVVLSFPGRPDWRADMVWKGEANWTKSYTRLTEIPF